MTSASFFSTHYFHSYFQFPNFFCPSKLLLVNTLIQISNKLTKVVFSEMSFFFIFYEMCLILGHVAE